MIHAQEENSRKQGQARVVIGAWNRRKYMVEKQFQTNMVDFFMKGGVVSEDLMFKFWSRTRKCTMPMALRTFSHNVAWCDVT